MLNRENPLVSICCITYNHEKYIAQCLDGFLMQKTTFPFEIVISNDCSTDNTHRIIQEYVNRYSHIFREVSPTENLGMINNFYHALNSCTGKYIAFCEGDDYWIDDKKLQMQVDFFEKNPEYGMCYTKVKRYNNCMNKFYNGDIGSDFLNFKNLLVGNDPIPTLTSLFKTDLLKSYLSEINPCTKNWLMGDYPMWLYFSYKTKIRFFDKITGVYRVLEDSASHFKEVEKAMNFRESVYDVKYYFRDLYCPDVQIKWNKKSFYFGCLLMKMDRKLIAKETYKDLLFKQKMILFFAKTVLLFYPIKLLCLIKRKLNKNK